METRKTALERAFEHAESGKCLTIHDIIKHLQSEKLDANQIQGMALKKQLQQIIEKAKRPP